VEILELFFAHSLTPLVVAASVPPACLVAAFWLHPLVGAALLPAVVAMATVPFWLRRRSAVQAGQMREAAGEATSEVVDAVQGLPETLVFGRQRHQAERLSAATERLNLASRAHRSRGGVEKAAGDAVAAVGLIGVLLVALLLVGSGSLAADKMVVVAVLGGFAFLPLMSLVDTWRELSTIRAAAGRLLRILEATPDVLERPQPVDSAVEPAIVFENVSFRYGPDQQEAVSDVSFAVPAGQTVALAGHSGAGKSTCASLLLRHWDVPSGVVRLGGHDVRELSFDRLRSTVVAVPQDTYLFAMSVRDNIRLARPDATDAEVEEAARTACAHDFVTALPDGYDTLAGERGAHLSGGQRQRLAIARALLTRAPVLVLDEAVSNLDADSEAAIDEALRAARGEHTTLIVAHRPSTLRTADTVVLLNGGKVVDIGPHDDLLARSAEYRRLLAQ
jgi:ATP-binding cassette subfamily C protein CydC